MNKKAEAVIIRLLEISGKIMMRTFAVMFAIVTLYALYCTFTGDGILALMGAVGSGFCCHTMWNF